MWNVTEASLKFQILKNWARGRRPKTAQNFKFIRQGNVVFVTYLQRYNHNVSLGTL